ncbi:hypothetical protein, partial [Escherichia coli]|uniref:hypothetical protein n=1 Tax=Escherichia coli TaxID=562 RepID=UPI00201AD632
LSNKPSASVSVATGESPNNDLTGQTNRARLYKGRPNIYGQCRVFPDLIQEALKVFGLSNKPSASVSVATGESPNNDLTGQTNRARLYKG